MGSILGSMEKPPTMGESERKKAREQKKQLEKAQQQDKEKLRKFRTQIQRRINDFLKDASLQKYKFEPMDKVFRAIIHEISETAGLTSFSFGQEEEDRYVLLWKKEFAPCDEEVAAYRRGEEWDPEKVKASGRQQEEEDTTQSASHKPHQPLPQATYKDKYEHIIGRSAAKDAAQATTANKAYGFVTSENKRDRRTIEEVMAESRAKKKQKVDEAQEANAPP